MSARQEKCFERMKEGDGAKYSHEGNFPLSQSFIGMESNFKNWRKICLEFPQNLPSQIRRPKFVAQNSSKIPQNSPKISPSI